MNPSAFHETLHPRIKAKVDTPPHFGYACTRPGRPGAAQPFEPRQDRKIATVRKCLRVPPVACPDIFNNCVYNLLMSKSNWIRIILTAIAGIALGLVYGWVIDPVEYVDVTPNILRADFRADYVMMVAEAHQSELGLETSAKRLAMLGSESPAQIVTSTLDYAKKNNFTQNEIDLLQELLTAMQTYQPQEAAEP